MKTERACRNLYRILPAVIFAMLFCTGCWDKKELNQLALAQIIAVDYEDDQYQMTLQFIIPSTEKENVTSDNLWSMTGKGDSVGEAIQQIALSAPREIYLDHLDLILLGEGVLEHDVEQALDYLLKENVLRRRTRLLAVQGNAGELLSASAELTKMDIFYMDNLLKDQNRRVHGSDAIINAYYLSMYNGLQETLVIPQLVMEEEKKLSLTGAALIQQGKLAFWADREWLLGYYWVTGGKEVITLTQEELPDIAKLSELTRGDSQVVVEVGIKKAKWEIVSESPLEVKAVLRGTIKIVSGYDSWKTRTDAETISSQIQQQVEEKALERFTAAVKKAQENGTDAFRLGRWLYAWHPDLVEAENWPAQFSSLPITVEMDNSVEVN